MTPEDPYDRTGVDELLDVLNRQMGRLQIPARASLANDPNFNGDRTPIVDVGGTGKPVSQADRSTGYQVVSFTNGGPNSTGSAPDQLKIEWGDGEVQSVCLAPKQTTQLGHYWEGHPTEPRVYAGQVTNLASGKVMPFFVIHPPENGVQPSWSSNGLENYGPRGSGGTGGTGGSAPA